MTNVPIAAQLYTVRDLVAADPASAVRGVAECGYPAAELAAADLALLLPLLREHGVRPVAAHVRLEDLDRPEAVFAELRAAGIDHAALSWLPPEERTGVDRVKRAADVLNRAAAVAAATGVRLGYHNHAFEFDPMDGTTAFRAGGELDRSLVFFELDVYWLAYAGLDPAEQIARWSGRAPLLHMKDMAPAADRDFAPVGSGILDWPAIVVAARACGCRWYIVEQDVSARPIEDLGRSLAHLEGLLA